MRGPGMMTAAVLALAAGGCAMREGDAPASGARQMAGQVRAEAALRTGAGGNVGSAVIQEVAGGLRVSVDMTGMSAGTHGVHVHAVGKCEGPDFTSAGGHWNPAAHQHGMENPMGPHMGDLPNLEVGADGTGHLAFTLAGATLAGLLDADGAAVVVHAKADDMKTDPSGNSGGRIACGAAAIPANI